MITFEDVKNNEEINAYIRAADKVMDAIGYTEHSFAHVTRAAEQAADILDTLGYSERTRELAKIAGYMHDIGNAVNRHEHALTGAVVRAPNIGNTEPSENSQGKGGDLRSKYYPTLTVVRKT